ncbi:MAG TPA: phage holin family protein [Chloroflexi bacterium]|nr:phage holin family protein [Chloroflexota bacterium]
MELIIGVLIGIVLAGLVSGVIIWIVGRLGLGLVVSGFPPALLAAFVIAILSGAITWLLTTLGLTIDGGIMGGIIHLLIAALVLFLSSRIVPGMMVQGPVGALIAALAIGAAGWLINALLSLFSAGQLTF